MSTRSTILAPEETNEHWYEELSYADEGIVFQFGKEHRVEIDEDGVSVHVAIDTPLYKAFKELLNQYYIRGRQEGAADYAKKFDK